VKGIAAQPAGLPRRIALVTQRYWPQAGGAESAMAKLAEELRRLGCAPTVVAPQWERHWPRELVYREVPVVRLPPAPEHGWKALRYMYSLSRWLKEHQDGLDGVVVSSLKHDAYSAIGTLRESPVPVVLRAEAAGAFGDCQWHCRARFGKRIRRRCQLADAVVAPCEAVADELCKAGFSHERLVRIDNGVSLPALRSLPRTAAARQALADANHDLHVASGPVVLYIGCLHTAKGLLDLVNAWPGVLRQHQGARLWIVGEGPQRERLFGRIGDLGLKYQISLPGVFDDVEDLLQAADLFVLPSYEDRTSLALLEAMAAGLPVVASDIPRNRLLIEHERTGLLFAAGDPRALAAALLRALDRPAESVQFGAHAREHAAEHFSLTCMAQGHLQLLARLKRQKGQEPVPVV
jgi:glycosyltransferase involved in cell wall biosynthesis